MITGIYRITNTLNGHVYIGSAVNIRQRWGNHKNELRSGRHANGHLQNAANKYGIENFDFEVLITCHRNHLIWYEQQFLDQLLPEYNISPTAGSPLGVRHSDETKKRKSVALKGKKRRPLSDEHRANLSASLRGRTLTHEHRENKSIAAKKWWANKKEVNKTWTI